MTHTSNHNYSLAFVVFLTFVLLLTIAFSARSWAQGSIPDLSTSVASEPLFLPAIVQQWGISPRIGSPSIADVSQDGKPDLVFMMVGDYPSSFGVLLGNGDGTIQPGELYPTGGQAASLPVIADVDKDGKPDLVVGQACAAVDCGDDALAGIVLGNGNGTFRTPFVYDLGAHTSSSSIAVADLNGDGKPDLVLTNLHCTNTGFEGCVTVLIADGNGRFQPPVVYSAGGWNSEGVVVVDLNSDGKPDLLIGNEGGYGAVGVLLGNGDGTFQPAVAYPLGGGYSSTPLVLDLNGDGKLDLVIYSQCTAGPQGCITEGRIGVLLGNGDGTFQPVMTVSSGGGGINSLQAADLNHDDILDLVVQHCGDTLCQTGGPVTVAVLLGNGDGTFTAGEIDNCGDSWFGFMNLAVADVNMDGTPDLITTTYSLEVRLGNGDGTFQPPVTYDTGGIYPRSLVVSDMNGDGKPDLVVAGTWDPYHGGVAVLLNNSSTTQASTRTTLTASSSTSTFGQSVVLTVQVGSGTAAPSGNVILFDGTAAVANGTLVNGKALIPVSYLPVGSNSITALYQAAPHFAASKSVALTHNVRIASTSVGLVTSLHPAATNQAVTYTATVNSQYGGLASGAVVFSSGSKILGTAMLSRNQATLTTSFANPGTNPISARYAGDANNTGSVSSFLSQRIIASTTTIVTSSAIRSLSRQAVTFTATVFATTGFPPNGDLVTFKSGPVVLGTAPLIGAVASFTTSSLPVGISNITASFAGDANFAPSTSSALRQVVLATTKSVTSTTIASSLNPSIYGQAVTFVAKVTTSGGGVPTGKVAFRGSGFEIGRTTLNSSGIATLTLKSLNANPYALTAVYLGDTNYITSTSPVLNQIVRQTTSTAKLGSSPNPSAVGQSVLFTATIGSPTVLPTGPVTFRSAAGVLGTAQLSNGKATLTVSTLPAGLNSVSVTYEGNSNISKSLASLAQTVQ